MTRYDSLRLIIALPTHLGLDTDPLDIKSAILNGDLVKEIWIVPPPGIGLDGKILRLDKALYGLKQAPGSLTAPVHHQHPLTLWNGQLSTCIDPH